MSRLNKSRPQRLHGIGEWYGKLFVHLTEEERTSFARLQKVSRKGRTPQPCPFQSTAEQTAVCTKEGGVCSLRLYERTSDGKVHAAGSLCTTCPNRFEEDRTIFRWIAQTILDYGGDPLVLGQVGFLERQEPGTSSDVGRIDNVLVVPDSRPLAWCAVETQAVYFQGASMKKDFEEILGLTGSEEYFPVARRQPDYRSSGPKRLMPQLQIKVPTLRRWGKKMAVVVDRGFFDAMGEMDTVRHVSNCDIAWFVVRYDEKGAVAELTPDEVYFTTLERSVEGLTAGLPVDLQTFEQRILARIPSFG